MKALRIARAPIVIAALLWNIAPVMAQGPRLYERVLVERPGGRRTVKPVVMGTHYAVTSMMPQATLAAQRILESGGNAFDAIVGGQAVLGLVAPASNGVGSDAQLMVYDAKQKKVWSLNAEGVAPRLATIAWFQKNRDGKIPLDDSLNTARSVALASPLALAFDGVATLYIVDSDARYSPSSAS